MNPLACLAVAATAALCLAATAVPAAAKTQTGFLLETLKQGSQTYKYTVYVPRDYDGARKWPLILFLHGSGESGTDGLKQMQIGIGSAIQLKQQDWPFIVILPQKPDINDAWEEHDAALMAMLARTRKDYSVDGSRLYLTGLSQGGHGTWVLGARHPDVWAAIAPICGYYHLIRETAPDPVPFPATLEDFGKGLKNTPIWAFHGTADPVVPVKETEDLVAAVRAAGGDPKMTLYAGMDHGVWDRAYRTENLGAWFLAHKKP